MKCSHCESELAGDARFCSQCGQAMQKANNGAGQSGERASGTQSEQQQGLRARVYAGVASGGEDHGAAGAGEAARHGDMDEPDILSGKVITSPFPALPQTAASLGLPDIGLNGAAVHALLAQANLCRMRRQWEEAVDCCVGVLRAQPANQSAHVLLGDIYRDQGRAEDAIKWYGMAVELRPNPTDQAKLDQVKREQERAARQASLRGRRGYDSVPPTTLAATDPNRGTTNLMGVSPRRWLRGITTVSLAFLALVLVGLIWTRMGGGIKTNAVSSKKPPTVVQRTGGTGLPPHRLDQTLPAHLLAQAANGDRSVLVGGGGLPPDHSLHSPTIAAAPRSKAFPGAGLPGSPVPSRAPLGMIATPNLPTQPVQNLRPLSPPPAPQQTSAVSAVAPPSNRLTDGLELTQTLGDGGVSATVLLTGPSSLVLDGSPHAQETLVRNVYRAARTAFAGNTMLTRVRVLIQTQVQGTGLASIVEAEADRDTATGANPTRDDAATLRSRLLSYRWSGATVAPAQEAASEAKGLGQ